MFAIKVMGDNFATCCFSHYFVISIFMSFKIMTEQCFVKEFKTEEKSMLNSLRDNVTHMLHDC